MKISTVVFTLWFVHVCLAARAETISTNGSAPQTVTRRSMLTRDGIVTTPERKTSPLFHGAGLPMPPMQYSRWKIPESQLPTNYISATRVLFEQGLADPRDCDYRVIEVGTGNVWGGDGGVVEAHGWVLPGKNTSHFAICWNGLIYPVVSVGTNADLERDVANIESNGIVTWRSALPEGITVSTQSMLGIRGCLLLRLGKVDLATRYWQAQVKRGRDFQNEMWPRGMPASPPATNSEVKLPVTDPYLFWATEWAWGMFDRTICAHMRGDEALALVTARQLAEAQPKIEAECAKRGLKRQKYWDNARQGKERPYLDFLDQLPQLLADLERRAKEDEHVSVVQSGLQNITNQNERITALIRDLDLVQAHQWGQPGGVNLPEDPIVSALIQEGDPAVEPLLDCMESDKRLTRSVGFWRDFSFDRTVIPVTNAANAAVQSILQAGFGSEQELRAYWNKYKGMNLDERCYVILKDDSARNRWLEAAAHITQPENVSTFPGGFSMTKPHSSNAPVRLRGEILRGKSNPSVTELMARRALEIPLANPNSYDISAACEMGLKLAQWDIEAAGPVVKSLSKRCASTIKYSGAQLGGLLTKLSLARAAAGDTNAFEDYAAWLPTTSPDQLGYSILEYFEPMEKFPTNAILQSAADKMFADTNSAWSRLPWQKSGSDNPASSELFSLPAFRDLLVRELDRKEVRGSISWHSPDMVNYSISNYMNGSFIYDFPEAQQTTNGTSMDLRWCDWIALSLSNGKHLSPYNPFAPVEKRDEALEKVKLRLRHKQE